MTLDRKPEKIETMAGQTKYIWLGLGILIWIFIFATFPRAIANFDPKTNYNFEFEFLPVGTVPIVKNEYEATRSSIVDSVTATHFQVTDLNSGAILLEKNATSSAFPASTTKMMTALVARDVFELEDQLLVTPEAIAEDNLLKLSVGEKLAAGDLIKALLINSSNESAETLALNYSAGRVAFVDLMNQKARDIHLAQSLFINPAGFDHENIYSTARDLTILAKELLKDEWLKSIVATKRTVITESTASGDAKFPNQHYLNNTNQLLFEMPEVTGVKTGTTNGAGQVLVALVEKEGRQVLFVVMGSEDRYQDTKKLMSWVDQAFDWVSVDFNNLIN